MKIVVYLDSYFLFNFIMNLLLLFLSGLFGGKQIHMARWLAAGALGAFAACILLVIRLPLNWLRGMVSYIVLPCIMLYIALPIHGKKEWIRMVVLYYLLSFLAGGFLTGILRRSASPGKVVVGMLVLMAAGTVCFLRERAAAGLAGMLYDVELFYKEKKILVTGMYDTGNQLVSPLSGEAVSLCELQAVEKLFTKEEIEEIREIAACTRKKAGSLPVFLIPFHAVGTETGLLPVLAMDEVIIHYGKRNCHRKHPLVAFYDGNLHAASQVAFIIHKSWK